MNVFLRRVSPIAAAAWIAAGASYAAELRFVTLHPTGAEGEWTAVVEGKGVKKKETIEIRADESVLHVEWEAAGKNQLRATLRSVPTETRRIVLGTAGKKAGEPQASIRVAPIEDGFGDSTIYHVMLGMFANGNPGNDGEVDGWRHPNYRGGDLQGVREKADYIAGLGVTAVWLSPLFAARTSHGYDVENYYRVGDAVAVPGDAAASLELLRSLVKDLRERGVRTILDLPLNHASRSYDRDTGDPGKLKPKVTPARQEAEKVWESWGAGFGYWNFGDEPTRRFLKDTALYWLTEENVDGLRLDYVRGVAHDFWAELYAEVKAKKPGAFLVGECWKDADGAEANAAEIAKYYEPVEGGKQFDSLLDFPVQIVATDAFARGGSLVPLEALLQTAELTYGPGAQPTYFLDNHDMARFLSWTDDERRLVAAVGFLAALSSPMVIFYGTETGLTHGAPRPGFIDAGRVPMPWDSLDSALTERVAGYLRARRDHPSLTQGGRLPILVDRDVLVMAKLAGGETALVGVNLSSEARTVELETAGVVDLGKKFEALDGHPLPVLRDGRLTWSLPPMTTAIVFQGR